MASLASSSSRATSLARARAGEWENDRRARRASEARERARSRERGGTRASASKTMSDDGDDGQRTIDALARTLGDEGRQGERAEETDGEKDGETSTRTEREEARERARERARRERARAGATKAWRSYWSPLSTVYNVPTEEPRGAYFLAFAHVAAFVADLTLLRLGYGNGGDVFLKLALFDNAVVYDSQWARAFTACFVDFGLLHFFVVNAALVTIGAEAEAILGTSPFLAVYVISAAMGGIGSMALDTSTLTVTSSDGLFGVFGALLVYAAINVENEWNMKGFTVRLLYCGAFSAALQYLASVPTEDGGHVVNSVGHLWGFIAGIAMGYAGLSPMFTSKKFETPPEDRMNLQDVTAGPPKTFAALGALSFTVLSLSVVVLLKRTLEVDPRDIF